jgi:hypothetical protein
LLADVPADTRDEEGDVRAVPALLLPVARNRIGATCKATALAAYQWRLNPSAVASGSGRVGELDDRPAELGLLLPHTQKTISPRRGSRAGLGCSLENGR